MHRLVFSRLMNQLLNKMRNIKQVARQSEMIRKNHIAVNCGSGDFYTATDGRLFFPDQKFAGNAVYGYFGKNKSVVRNISGLKDAVTPELFRTEAYDIDGYKFRLANGKYTVRLYMKIGYPSDFKDNKVIFTAYAQGKPLFVKIDMYKASKGDFTTAGSEGIQEY